MDATDVQLALRRAGVAAHHVVRSASTIDGRDLVVVFLEASRSQSDVAAACVRHLPDVLDVSFARHTRAIMYVFSRAAGPAPGRSP